MRSADHSSPGISIVSVYNDEAVLEGCLMRSVLDYEGPLDVDVIAVDNRAHAFTSAGAALNHGSGLARHDRILFVHQDVYLHSIDHLYQIGQLILNGSWGLLGANGMTHAAQSVGRIRDRVKLVGEQAPSPIPVDSVDEVAFMVSRQTVLEHPLTEDPGLAWHAYAVEYGLRLHGLGSKVGVIDFGVTHNSLTINLDRLDVAHRRVANLFPACLPINTTCGTIGSIPSRVRELPFIRRHRWLTTWLRQSYQAARINRIVTRPVVIADICHDVDLLSYSSTSPLHVLNVDNEGAFTQFSSDAIRLIRRDRPVVLRAVQTVEQVLSDLDLLPINARILVTDPQFDHIRPIVDGRHAERDWIIGTQNGAFWLLAGPDVNSLPSLWLEPRATPLLHRARPVQA